MALLTKTIDTVYVAVDCVVVKAKFHYAISSRAGSRDGLRPASELDSAMEFGLSGAAAANLSATRFELSRHVEIARTCLRQVGNQPATSSRAGLRLASELDSA